MNIIARIYNDFPEKFGIPRQPGLVEGLEGRIIFEPEYRVPEALRGLEGYSHIWLIWDFSEYHTDSWSPTVRPPHLGGNRRMGVFATRSPNRPNPIGLSVVRLLKIDSDTEGGPALIVSGADLMNGTPIYDIKPYLPYVEAIPDAKGGFTDSDESGLLQVVYSRQAEEQLHAPDAFFPAEKEKALTGILAQDPRPHYQADPQRVYGLSFAGAAVKFKVDGDCLTVLSVLPETD